MELSELRVGNLVYKKECPDFVVRIVGVSESEIQNVLCQEKFDFKLEPCDIEELCPIPIVPALLLANGWIYTGGHYVLKNKDIRLGWNKGGEFILGYALYPKKVLYWHELQNILADVGLSPELDFIQTWKGFNGLHLGLIAN